MSRLATVLITGALILALPIAAAADRRYVVRSGDTLSSIARRNGLRVEQLRRANRLRSDRIRPGARLVIPSRGGGRATRRDFGTHRVRAGDTLARIARRYDVTITALRRHNRLRGNLIRPGTRLRIPGRGMGRVRAEGAQPDSLTRAQRTAAARAADLGLGTSRVAHSLLTEAPEPRWVSAAGSPSSDGTLRVPVDGRFLRGWGSGAGGYHLAVDLGAERGTDVRAADAGIVAYAGNAVRGYGNVVIVVHGNGRVTWYAHNHQNLVVAGQRVRRGEVIATVGDTGYARGTHLHFMLVDDGAHCDALPLLRPAIGDEWAETTRWLDERPEAVRCLARSARPHPRHRRRARARSRRRAAGATQM